MKYILAKGELTKEFVENLIKEEMNEYKHYLRKQMIISIDEPREGIKHIKFQHIKDKQMFNDIMHRYFFRIKTIKDLLIFNKDIPQSILDVYRNNHYIFLSIEIPLNFANKCQIYYRDEYKDLTSGYYTPDVTFKFNELVNIIYEKMLSEDYITIEVY